MTTRLKATVLSLIVVLMLLSAMTHPTIQPASAATPRPTRTPATIIVEVTEQQFIKAVGRIRFFSDQKKLTVDIVEGQTVFLFDVNRDTDQVVLFHLGVFIEKNRVVVRAISFEGNGVVEPIDETIKRFPKAKPAINRMGTILTNVVRNQVARKVRGRYTIQNAVFTQDKLVITILK